MSSWDTIGIVFIMALLGAAFYTLYSRDKRRDAKILADMRSEFLPRLSENLRAVAQRVEGGGAQTLGYEEQLYSGLSKSLLIEFDLRFPKEGETLAKIRRDLAKYETVLSEGSETLLPTVKAELLKDIDRFLKDVEKLKEMEKIPPRRMRTP